jgi:hypothetical protein
VFLSVDSFAAFGGLEIEKQSGETALRNHITLIRG